MVQKTHLEEKTSGDAAEIGLYMVDRYIAIGGSEVIYMDRVFNAFGLRLYSFTLSDLSSSFHTSRCINAVDAIVGFNTASIDRMYGLKIWYWYFNGII
jgi:hypothetical protein